MSIDCPDEEVIFAQAIEIADRKARSEFLDRACEDNVDLRKSLEQLLACHDTAGDYLETPPVRRLAESSEPLDKIDRYELLECVGEGGFGVVYRAMQLVPLRRIVALKIIRLGMDSQEVVRRFEAERQVMSMMSHPHIAAVLDAGTTQSGRPYFGMEFVDGQPIDQFCEQHRLTVSEILELFLNVCVAIQHAHQKGVVHRDLKPSNIIVTPGESRPIPKVIDFGIAKALSAIHDETLYQTVEHRILGTPGYMSPEQVARKRDVDTRADVYALGGILYRLLVGVEPIDMRSPDDGAADTYQIIRDGQIKRPSVRLNSMAAEVREPVAEQRNSTATQLIRTVSGDLDWIVMRALETDRDRRYSTVQELATDVERCLRHEPISAGPPTIRYRIGKFVRRNQLATAASLLVALSLAVGGTMATVGMIRANRESQRAQAEGQRAEQQRLRAAVEAEKAIRMLQMLEKIVGASHPDQGHPPDYTMRELISDFSDSFDAELSGQPELAARLHRTIGRASWSLGDMGRAGEHLARSLELYAQQLGYDQLTTAQAGVDYALYLIRMSRITEAHETVLRALEVLEQHPAEEQTVWAHFVLARVHHEHAEADTSLKHITLARDIAQQALGPQNPLAISMRVKASTQLRSLRDANRESGKALDDLSAIHPEHHMDVAEAKRHRAIILMRLGKFAEAEKLVREAMETHQFLLGPESSYLTHDMIALTRVLRRSGEHEEAREQARATVALAERVMVERDCLRQVAYQKLATLLQPVAPSEAIDVWQQAIEAKRGIVSPHIDIAKYQRQQAGLYIQLDQPTEAVGRFRECLKTLEALTEVEIARGLNKRAGGETVYFTTAVDLVTTLTRLGRIPEATLIAAEISKRAQKLQFDQAIAIADVAQARIEFAEGELDLAREKVIAAIKQLSDARNMNARIRAVLLEGEILTEMERYDQAQRILVRAYRLLQRRPNLPDHFKYSAAKQLAILFERADNPEKAATWAERARTYGDSVN